MPSRREFDLVVCSFGYIKTTINKQIDINSRTMQFIHSESNFKKLIPDFVNYYPDVVADLDPGFFKVFGLVMEPYSL